MDWTIYLLLIVPCACVCVCGIVCGRLLSLRGGAEVGRKMRCGEERFEAERLRFLSLKKEVAETMRSATFLKAYVNVLLIPFPAGFEDMDYMLSGPKQEDMMCAKFRLVVERGFCEAPLELEMFDVGPEKHRSTYDGCADFLGAVNGRLEDFLRDICVLEPICRAVREDRLRIDSVERIFKNA